MVMFFPLAEQSSTQKEKNMLWGNWSQPKGRMHGSPSPANGHEKVPLEAIETKLTYFLKRSDDRPSPTSCVEIVTDAFVAFERRFYMKISSVLLIYPKAK
jgi:hypothetical protein